MLGVLHLNSNELSPVILADATKTRKERSINNFEISRTKAKPMKKNAYNSFHLKAEILEMIAKTARVSRGNRTEMKLIWLFIVLLLCFINVSADGSLSSPLLGRVFVALVFPLHLDPLHSACHLYCYSFVGFYFFLAVFVSRFKLSKLNQNCKTLVSLLPTVPCFFFCRTAYQDIIYSLSVVGNSNALPLHVFCTTRR